MNFALTLLGFLFAICAVASQSSVYNPSCSIQPGPGTDGCTSTQDLQTMCSKLSQLSSLTPLYMGDMVGICVGLNLMNLTSVEANLLTYADIIVSNSAPSKAGSSQYESLVNVLIEAFADLKVKIPLVSENQYASLMSLVLGITGNLLSNSDSNSGTGCYQAGENTNILTIMANLFEVLGLNNQDSKSASNILINTMVGINAELSSTVTEILSSLGMSGDISTDINAAITDVLRKGTSTSDAACSNAADCSSLVDAMTAVLVGSGKSQSDSSGVATFILNDILKVVLQATGILQLQANIGLVF